MHTTPRNLFVGLGLVLAASTLLAAPPANQPPGGNLPPPAPGQRGEPLPPFLHGVALTNEQRDKIFDITYAQIPAQRAHEKELQATQEALIKLSQTAEFDDIKAKALADTAARALSELSLMRARTDYKIYRLLTAEQRKQIDEVRRPICERGEPPRR